MPAEPEKSFLISAQDLDFISCISLHYENVYSVPPIAARILALLLLVPHNLTIQEITSCLSVSHGSVSTNLNLLILLGYVEKQRSNGKRPASYRFLPRSRIQIMHQRISHYQELKQLIEAGRRQAPLPEQVSDRLDEMVAWSDLAIRKFSEFIVEWEGYMKRR